MIEWSCKECGKPEDASKWIGGLKMKPLCFNCDHFISLIAREGLIVKGEHFMDAGRDKGYGLGHGGAEFVYKKDGQLPQSTNNLWHQGHIPKHLKRVMPDNAVFLGRRLKCLSA